MGAQVHYVVGHIGSLGLVSAIRLYEQVPMRSAKPLARYGACGERAASGFAAAELCPEWQVTSVPYLASVLGSPLDLNAVLSCLERTRCLRPTKKADLMRTLQCRNERCQ